MERNQEADRIARLVLAQLEDHMNDTDKYAPAYVRRYVAGLLAGKRGTARCPQLHPDIAHLIRDAVLDEMTATRRGLVA
jgi:hypothetical protein